MKRDIHAEVTTAILAQLEKGTAPWRRSWSAADIGRPLRSCGTPYQGINTLVLWASAAVNGFTSDRWATFNQAKALGGKVRKGSKGTHVVYAQTYPKNVDGPNGETVEETRAVLRSYTVFNVDQIDGMPERFYAKRATVSAADRNARADAFLAATGATIHHSGARAFYGVKSDAITLPDPGAFDDMGAYYATAAHELIHWSATRVGRMERGSWPSFGSESYAFEELVAEIGAAYLCADLGLDSTVRADHADYMASWLKTLQGDKRAIFRAATAAQKAVAYLTGFEAQAAQAVAA